MNTKIRKVGQRGQITIPKEIREKEDIQGGDEVKIIERDGELIIKKLDDREKLKEGYQRMAEQSREISEEMLNASKEALDRQ